MPPADPAPTGTPQRIIQLWQMHPAAYGEALLRSESVEHPTFVWLEPDHAYVAELRHDRMRAVVGRSPRAELPIPSNDFTNRVSRHHATIERHYDRLTIRDTSSNGTHLNAEPVRDDADTVINDRDEIHLARNEDHPAGVVTIYVRCPVLEIPGTFNIPKAPDWTTLTRTQLQVIVTMLDLWPTDSRATSKPPTNEQLSRALGSSVATVKSHINRALENLDAKGHDRQWLARQAIVHEIPLREAHAALG